MAGARGTSRTRAAASSGDGNAKAAPANTKAPAKPKATPRGKRAARQNTSDLSDVPEPTGLTSEEESDSDSDAASGDAFEPTSESEADDASEVDSDDIDDEPAPAHKGKRKSIAMGHRTTPGNLNTSTNSNGGGKRAKVAVATTSFAKQEPGRAKGKGNKSNAKQLREDDNDSDSDIELEEGQTVIGRIFKAPKTGLVPPGRISRNTLDFLECLMYPENNDRDWFKSHEPAFRMAEQEFRDFAQLLQVKMSEADPQVPVLPARDICHRIYRDVRFSPDKSPYKANFGLTTSRSGRRGIWAGYHLYLQPGGSLIACGTWQPERDVLQRIRARIAADPSGLRQVINAPEFVQMFGPAKAHPGGKRQNVFGHSDMLKVAPKGVDKTHKDIDLLKLRSITVVRHFTDEEVLSPNFADLAGQAVAVMRPFIHMLNTYIAPPQADDDDSDDSDIEALD